MKLPDVTRRAQFTLASLVASLTLFGGPALWAQAPARWKQHDHNRPRPAIVAPPAQTLPVPPPADAVVLFDGRDLSHWQSADGQPPRWIVRDGVMESVPGAGYLYSARSFGDVQLHVEWASPARVEGHSQGRGNSGVFLMGLFEVQVLDSYDNITYADGQAGAIYGQYPPLVNVCRPPGQWQSYDISFRRPRFGSDGRLQHPARLSVWHNGVLIQDNVEPWGPTSWLQALPYEPTPAKLPLSLQDHGNPVRYRNIWLRELPEQPGPQPPADDRPVITLPHDQLARYVGRYGEAGRAAREIRLEGDRLQLNTSGAWLDLVPHSPSEFSLPWTQGGVQFELDDQGRPVALQFQLSGEDHGRDPRQ
ncbi:MAG: family 16 glycoside hydrolase [Pirellulales bacterium]